MSNDDEKIPVATVAVEDEDEADRAPPVPVKISKVTMTARKCDFGGKAYYCTSENDSYATSVP